MRLRTAPAELARLIDQAHGVRTQLDSWLGGTLLASEVPLTGGQLVERFDQEIPEALTFTVPAKDPRTGLTWHPGYNPAAPLASMGQRIRAAYVVERGDGRTALTTQLGWYQITNWDADDRLVEVEAVGLLNLVKESKLLAPTSPPNGATIKSEIRRLVQGLLPVAFDVALVDRPVPRSMAWTGDRLAALYELADAWPSELYVDEGGTLRFVPTPVKATAAAVTFRELAGTVISNRASGTRDAIANVVVARGEDSSDPARPPITAVARDDDPASPTRAGGPFGDVVEHFSSPLLGTTAEAFSAARKILRRKLIRSKAVPLETMPDPRLRPGIRADFVPASGSTFKGAVAGTTLPLTADGGAMAVDVEELTEWT